MDALLGDEGDDGAPKSTEKARRVIDAIGESDLVAKAPAAMEILNRALDNTTAELIESCIAGGDEDFEPQALDVFAMRDAIFEVNDFAELMAMEKNSLGGLAAIFQKTVISAMATAKN